MAASVSKDVPGIINVLRKDTCFKCNLQRLREVMLFDICFLFGCVHSIEHGGEMQVSEDLRNRIMICITTFRIAHSFSMENEC